METYFEPIKIPQSHIDFANEVALLADKYKISKFTLEYEPHWNNDGGDEWDRRIAGKAIIRYSDKDGRQRPCKNISISIDAQLAHIIKQTPQSSD